MHMDMYEGCIYMYKSIYVALVGRGCTGCGTNSVKVHVCICIFMKVLCICMHLSG